MKLTRCTLCYRFVVRRSGTHPHLCVSCADGVRAVASAAESESQVRARLYAPTDSVVLRPLESARHMTEQLDGRRLLNRLRGAVADCGPVKPEAPHRSRAP